MSLSRDRAARFSRLSTGKNTHHDVTDSVSTHTMQANAVAFNVYCNGSDTVRVTSDGSNPSGTAPFAGFGVPENQQLGWVDCVGSMVLKLTCADSSSVEVWEICDEDS